MLGVQSQLVSAGQRNVSLKDPRVLEYPTTYPIDARLSRRRAGLHQIKYHLESNNYVAGFQQLLLLLDLGRKK